MQHQEGSDDEQEGSGNQLELLKSYLAFARRAVSTRKGVALTLFAVMLAIGSAALAAWPRTFTSELRLVVQSTGVLDPYEKLSPLESAEDVITRQENLKALVTQLKLVKRWDASRAPALQAKDKVRELFFGSPRDEDIADALVSMMESRLHVSKDGNALRISVDWPDPEVAKQVANAAKDSFLESRHTEEISVIEEKMSIFEGHATRLRTEIEGIATELSRVKSEKRAQVEKAARQVSEAAAPAPNAAPAAAPRPRRAPSADDPASDAPVEDVAELKEEHSAKKSKLTDLQSRRSQSLLETKGKLAELKFKYTSDHPEVRRTEQRIALLSKESPEEAQLASDVAALEGRLKRATASAKVEAMANRARGGGDSGRSGGATSAAADVLPSEILRLLDDSNELDPAISTQLSTAIGKYGELRGELRSARIQLDSAQAAFQHRYKIIVPTSLPQKPSKPKVPLALAICFAVALGVALLIPIVLELKTGVIVELWQVHQFRLPVLGDLQLPPRER